jgi:hypothetical protein
VAEEASPHHFEPVTSDFTPSGVADAEIGISDSFKISSTVAAGGPPTVVEGTKVSHQVWREAEAASPESSKAITEGTVFSDTEDSGVSDGFGTSSTVVGLPTVGTGAGGSRITTSLCWKIDNDTMPYAYPKYSVERQAQHRLNRLGKPWTGSVWTDRTASNEPDQYGMIGRLGGTVNEKLFLVEEHLGVSVGSSL